MVLDVLHGHAQGRLYRTQEEPQVGPYRRMGKWQTSCITGILFLTLMWDVTNAGHAILQLHILEPLLGIRPAPSIELARLARKRSTEKRHPTDVRSVPRGYTRQQGHEAHQQEVRRQVGYRESSLA